MYDFANYAFNKAHAVCYAVMAYQTAWFKYYYPKEYMAALMTSVLDSSVKISEYIAECKNMGIALLPPDINESNDHFTVVPNGIRFGLAAIKNIGRGFIQKVMQERENGGAFMGLEDFCSRMYGTDLNKRAMENLIKCGACDCFGLKRSQLLAIYDAVMESVAASRRNNVEGQMGLFGMMEGDDAPISDIHVPDLPELSAQERMSMERETTGLYLSGHPMDDYREQLKGTGVVPIGRILQSLEEHDDVYQDEQVVSIAGIVQTAKMKTTRNQSLMAYVTLEDNTGSMELMLFSSTLKQYGGLIHEGAAVVINGRISIREDKDPQMVVNRVWAIGDMQAAQQDAAPQYHTLYLRVTRTGQKGEQKLLPILKMFPGKLKTVIYYADTGVRRGGTCAPQEVMLQELRELLGEKNVVLK